MILLNNDEALEIAKTLWNDEKMQKYLVDKYDFYKFDDGLVIELEKVNKITIELRVNPDYPTGSIWPEHMLL